MTDSSPYSVPGEPGRWRAIALAACVHAALLALLWFGVSWQSETPVAVEAEVWSMKAIEAAPKAAPLPEPVPPKARPEPPPVPAQPPREAPPPPIEPPVAKAPDIALERERKRVKEQREREQEQAAELAERKQRTARLEAEELRKQKIQQQAQLKQEQKEQQQLQQQLQRQAAEAEALARKKIDDQNKVAAEKQRKQEALDEQKLALQREENLRRMTDSASSSSSNASNSGSGGNGEAARSQGARADASYIQKVGAKIKSNTVFNGANELESNPAVEFAVELLPDGSIRRLRKTKASGVPGFDDAVSRAIEKSQPFPPDKSGSAPSGFTVSHKPKDQ